MSNLPAVRVSPARDGHWTDFCQLFSFSLQTLSPSLPPSSSSLPLFLAFYSSLKGPKTLWRFTGSLFGSFVEEPHLSLYDESFQCQSRTLDKLADLRECTATRRSTFYFYEKKARSEKLFSQCSSKVYVPKVLIRKKFFSNLKVLKQKLIKAL